MGRRMAGCAYRKKWNPRYSRLQTKVNDDGHLRGGIPIRAITLSSLNIESAQIPHIEESLRW